LFANRSAGAILLAVLAACGSVTGGPTTGVAPPTTTTAPTTTTTVDTAFPATVAAANGVVTIETRPSAIISLSPTATEMLFAIGAGNGVVAVDDNSNYPAEAPLTDLSGFEPNVEAIASYRPDLVVVSFDPGDLLASLGALDIPVLMLPAAVSLDDTYTQIEQLGAATGHLGEAAELVAEMRTDMALIAEQAPKPVEPLTYYHELDPTLYSATSTTFIGSIYSLLGLINIADPADEGGSGYPQLSAEHIIAADPDLIFLADTKCCGQDASTVAARPGWEGLTAVTSGGVVELDDDLASRWGPRVVDFLRLVAERMGQLVAAG
jgi:iron complex transport system substrate-binding protein